MNDSQPSVTVSIPCFEGPGNRCVPGTVELTEADLVRHVLLLGSTGAGKTSLLRSIMRQVIASNACDSQRKPGLLIFDFKGDQTADLVAQYARRVGRGGDVRVLSLTNPEIGYQFFGRFRELADAPEYAERMTFASGTVSERDKFWDESRESILGAALTWLWLTDDCRDFQQWVQHAASWILADGLPSELKPSLDRFRTLAAAMPSGTPEKAAADHALRTIDDYVGGMDARTRSNIRATISNAIRPLLTSEVLRMFAARGADNFDVNAVVDEGGIYVISLSSFLYPHLSALAAKALKADFFRAIFRRSGTPASQRRLALMVADEYHLAATVGSPRFDDALALPLLREFNGGVIAATQTVAGIDRAIGAANRQVLLPNFGTTLFLRTTEPLTADYASKICGTAPKDETIRERQVAPGPGTSKRIIERSFTRSVMRPICTPDALSRLEPGQAFLNMPGVTDCVGPIWFAEDDGATP